MNFSQQIVRPNSSVKTQVSYYKQLMQKSGTSRIDIMQEKCYLILAQQTYISEKVVRKFNLMSLQEGNVGLKAFASEKEKVTKLKAYEIWLQLLFNNRDIVVRS